MKVIPNTACVYDDEHLIIIITITWFTYSLCLQVKSATTTSSFPVVGIGFALIVGMFCILLVRKYKSVTSLPRFNSLTLSKKESVSYVLLTVCDIGTASLSSKIKKAGRNNSSLSHIQFELLHKFFQSPGLQLIHILFLSFLFYLLSHLACGTRFPDFHAGEINISALEVLLT